jgi:hypothetical protein
MAILGEKRFVERSQFFDGQRLFAADLDAVSRSHQELRWLHNQSLHQPGVGRGFAVSGKKGDKSVTVQEGYALDREGREIVLTMPKLLQVPPVAGNGGQPAVFDLVVAYPSDEALDVTETREGICVSPGAVRRREEPTFCWVEISKDGQPSDEKLKQSISDASMIRLARTEVLACKLARDVSVVERRDARPREQPFIAAGVEKPVWDFRDKSIEIAEGDFKKLSLFKSALTADISTGAAGFRTTPLYFVEIRGKRPVVTEVGTFFVDGIVTITGSKPDGFKVEIDLLVQGIKVTGSDFAQKLPFKDFADWEISWLGVEG